MAFNVNEFNSKINEMGVAQSNLFVARITVPDGDVVGLMPTSNLQFLCRTADIPEFTVATTPFRPRGIGPAEQRPTTFDYGPLNLVFMMDSNFNVLKFFHRWMQKVVNYDVTSGGESVASNGTRPYEFGYKDEYAAVIDVKIFSNPLEDKFYEYRFDNAYPTSVGQITTAWENNAEILLLPITFAYDEMKVTGSEAGVPGGGAAAAERASLGWVGRGDQFDPRNSFNAATNAARTALQGNLQSNVDAFTSGLGRLRGFFSL